MIFIIIFCVHSFQGRDEYYYVPETIVIDSDSTSHRHITLNRKLKSMRKSFASGGYFSVIRANSRQRVIEFGSLTFIYPTIYVDKWKESHQLKFGAAKMFHTSMVTAHAIDSFRYLCASSGYGRKKKVRFVRVQFTVKRNRIGTFISHQIIPMNFRVSSFYFNNVQAQTQHCLSFSRTQFACNLIVFTCIHVDRVLAVESGRRRLSSAFCIQNIDLENRSFSMHLVRGCDGESGPNSNLVSSHRSILRPFPVIK